MKERERERDISFGGSLRCQNSQTCPADDLIHGSCRAGLSHVGTQRQEGAGGRVSASSRLGRTGQRGKALLQGSARTSFAGRDHAGAWSVGHPVHPLLWLSAMEGDSKTRWINGEFPPAANSLITLPQEGFLTQTKTWQKGGNARFIPRVFTRKRKENYTASLPLFLFKI